MKRLVFDIETVGNDFDSLDPVSQDSLTKRLGKKDLSEEEYETRLGDIKDSMGLSPLTAEVVAIGVLDCEKEQGAVYFQAPGEKIENIEEEGIAFKQMNEKEMLERFWQGANEYDEFITFNGRRFDVPFLMVRSAIHGIRPTRNLMDGRYLYQQRDAVHIDLYDLLTFYGAMAGGNLHLWCRAFGIESPKTGEVEGGGVGKSFREKRYMDIARYNARDVKATRDLFRHWNKYLRF